MENYQKSLECHKKWQGKISTHVKSIIQNKEDLSLAYTPGVAAPCKEIVKYPDNLYDYTIKGNTIAIVSDGSAVLGLGNIGPYAALPVMEGKAVLFKEFADLNAFPICLNTQDSEEIIQTIINISPVFGGINLEDISAPRCFYIEERLKETLSIPVFHDDQHGTAVVVLAAIINALKLIKKSVERCKVVINGAGAAGIAIAKLLGGYGFEQIILCDKAGALYEGVEGLNGAQASIARSTNPKKETGELRQVIVNSDIFIGVSAPNTVDGDMIRSMNHDGIVFAMANPIPEILPEEAIKAGAKIVGTGRSDYPNQVNNVLAFPGIMKAAVKAKKQITDEVKMEAAQALATFIHPDELSFDKILPYPFEKGIAMHIAKSIESFFRS